MADPTSALLAIWLLSIGTVAAATWLANAITARQLRDGYWREFNTRRRGSNPPSPGRKPAPPAGPPIRMDESPTQCGNGNGGPATPKPPIKPQPHGGRLFINNKPPEEN